MKKLSVILVAFVLLLGTQMAATDLELAKDKKLTVSQEIGDLLKSPELILEKDVKAYVTFLINEEGEIVVLTVDSDNLAIERYIKGRLNYKKLQHEMPKSKEYKVPILIKA